MPITKKRTHSYHTLLRRQRTSFPCPHCNVSILIKDYEGHCTKQHGLNARLCCVWCDGERSWRLGQKERMIDDHVVECIRKFLFLHCRPEILSEETALKAIESHSCVDETPKNLEKDFFGRSPFPHPLAYESIFEPNDEWWFEPDLLTFHDENLNLAAHCVRKYIATRDKFDWIHVMVRYATFDSFYEAMETYDHGKTVILPFWCWCDGGTEKDAHFRQLRHMIVVFPKGHFFKNVWSRIRLGKDVPYRGYKCKKSRVMEHPLHLVNTLGFVSQRESQCDVSFDTRSNLNHFRINLALPKLFRWVLCSLWDPMELIDQECHNLTSEKLAQYAKLVEGSWKVPVQYLPNIPKDLVLPVSKHFKPTSRATPYFIHLTRDKKLYFEKDESLLEMDDEAWGKLQAKSGNVFCHSIGNELWCPHLHHQRNIYVIRPILERNVELKNKLKIVKIKLDNVKMELSKMKEAEKKRKREVEELEKSKRNCHVISRYFRSTI